MAVIDKITDVNQFHAGDVVTEGVFNQISELLIRAGLIKIAPADDDKIAALVDQESKANAQLGDYAYLSADGKIMFGETYGEDDSVFGVVGDNDGDSVLIFALNEASTDLLDPTDIPPALPNTRWGVDTGKSYGLYSSAVGSFKADGTKVEDEDPDVAFTIKKNVNTISVKKNYTDPTFIDTYGSASGRQRTMAMVKNNTDLGPFPAATACYEYNPILGRLNMRGLWYLPLAYDLDFLLSNMSTLRPKMENKGNIGSIPIQKWMFWTSLESSEQYGTSNTYFAWRAYLSGGMSMGQLAKVIYGSTEIFTIPVMRL